MFSPYAAASGSAENNAGQGIGNQVPSASADTSMEGQTTTHIADGSGGSSGSSSSPVVSPTPTPTTPTPATLSASLSASSSSVSPYESVSFDLTTTTAFSSVYWYVAGPGDSGLGSNVETDTGGSSSTSASLSYSFPSDASGDYVITAYIYNYSDSSIYQSSHTVSVSGSSSVSSDETPNCSDCTSHCSSPRSCSNSGTCNGTVSTPSTPSTPTLVACGGASYTGCSGASSRTEHHVPLCSNGCGNGYWTCDPNASLHTETKTCKPSGCGATLTPCQNGPTECINGGYHWL